MCVGKYGIMFHGLPKLSIVIFILYLDRLNLDKEPEISFYKLDGIVSDYFDYKRTLYLLKMKKYVPTARKAVDYWLETKTSGSHHSLNPSNHS